MNGNEVEWTLPVSGGPPPGSPAGGTPPGTLFSGGPPPGASAGGGPGPGSMKLPFKVTIVGNKLTGKVFGAGGASEVHGERIS